MQRQVYFEEAPETKEDVARSVYQDEGLLFRMILRLHVPTGYFELDPTYSTGRFYKGLRLPEPTYRFDLEPQAPGVIASDCRYLPLGPESVSSILFDPPFIAGGDPRPSVNALSQGLGKPGLLRDRFGSYKTMPELWSFYHESLQEFYRVLKTDGVLTFKCQDSVSGGLNYFSHIEVFNSAVKLGFYPLDLFLLLAKSRAMSPNMKIQHHARKYHSYFWIFQKTKNRVTYTEPNGPVILNSGNYGE